MTTSPYQYSADPTGTHALLLGEIAPKTHVLDIGCASGYLGGYLVQKKQCEVWGIEPHTDRWREAAGAGYEVLINGTVEDALRDPRFAGVQFDHILIGDVLEHLVEPEDILKQIAPLLFPGGTLVVSLPNVAHYSVRCGLLFGRWDMQDAGILDRTHLHFYTEKTAKELFAASGWDVIGIRPRGDIERWFAQVGMRRFGLFLLEATRRLSAVQFVFVLKKT